MEIKSLYQEVILDHNMNPKNYGILETYNYQQLGHNPLCGDKLILFVQLDQGSETIINISFQGESCAIAKASTSILTELVKGKSVSEILTITQLYEKMLLGQKALTLDEEVILGKITIFSGVKKYPARVKCAMLSCRTLQAIVKKEVEASVTTE